MGHKQHGAKKFEQYYGQPYEPKTFQIVYECRSCGWRRPGDSVIQVCQRCGKTLVARTIKVEKSS